jgi:hypothetical protein
LESSSAADARWREPILSPAAAQPWARRVARLNAALSSVALGS